MARDQCSRRSARKPHDVRAMVEVHGSCSVARIVSVSRNGVGIATDIHQLPQRYDRVRIEFQGRDGDILISGDVRWSIPRAGEPSKFGVQVYGANGAFTGFYDSLPLS
jgi:hypothetical protein